MKIFPKPYTLTDADISAVLSTNTVSAKLTDAGIAAAMSVATVASKVAGIGAGAVGSTELMLTNAGNQLAYGATVSGGNLFYTDVAGKTVSAASGTWICMGRDYGPGAVVGGRTTTFMRIA